jgi:hypothetical protein
MLFSLLAGWMIFVVGLAQLVVWSVWLSYQNTYEGKSKLSMLFKYDKNWGPDNPVIRSEWQAFKVEMLEKNRYKALGHSKLKKFLWNLLGKY